MTSARGEGPAARAPGGDREALHGWLEEPLERRLGTRAHRAHFEDLGLVTVGDLLRHYPRRYERWGELTPLARLPEGEEATVVAEVVSAFSRPMRSRRGDLLKVVVTDGIDTLDLTFFHAARLRGALRPGRRALFSGTVKRFQGRLELTHPKIRTFAGDDDEWEAISDLDTLIPVYPASAKVTSEAIRRCVGMVLDTLGDVADPLPVEVRARHGLMSLRDAMLGVHRPAADDDWHQARHRLRFEEAFVLQAALAKRRAAERALPATARPVRSGGLLDAFDARMPFELTAGQRRVASEIAADLAAEHPMHRLLQGEVGSGKTVVALRAMLTVVDAGGQAALLAPTEVLAGQHLRSITGLLGDLAAGGMLGGDERGTRVVLLTGSMPAARRREALLAAVSGDAGIVIGTHALLQEKVEFRDLGLVVVDEQHRFGVEQRDALRGKGRVVPHLLVMTATPIPRTVAMTVFGDLEISTLDEVPPGRSPVTTHVVPIGERPAWVERTWQRVREEVAAGHQVYVVCPRIGDGEPGVPDDLRDLPDDDAGPARRPAWAVLDALTVLRDHPELAGVRVEPMHGRMSAEARDAAMAGFVAGEVQVLVSTTVIEVGVDVPNATMMVIMDADRFGVSQLHQLRGRVGRGREAGLCLLLTEAEPGGPARQRLDAVAATTDGFAIAAVDLEQRREGDVLGAAQSGVRSSLRLLRVLRDEKLILSARHEAAALVAADPSLGGHPVLAAAIDQLVGPDREAYLERG